MKTTMIIPTLNEIDGCKAVLPQINRSWADQIIITDGGSTDGTIEWCRANGYQVYVQKHRGIRYAYLEVMPLVEGDVIITISPDGNCDLKFIPDILDLMRKGYDLVIGSRYYQDARSDDDDIVTGFGNWLFTLTVNILHCRGEYKFSDVMVIYRAFRKEMVYELDLDKEETYRLPERLFGTRISIEPVMSVRAAKCGMKIADVPAGEPARLGGERKLQVLRWGAAYYFQFWRELFFWKKGRKGRTY